MSTERKPAPDEGAGSQTSRGGDGHRIVARAWLFHCPHCGYLYESPVEILEASHRCPARGGAVRRLREGAGNE